MVVLPLLGVLIAGWPFGYASAPYDPKWALAHPRRAALMALAGPAANTLLVIALAIAAGAHPKAIQSRMGHSSINVTLDRYGHLLPELDEAIAEARKT